MASIHGRLIPVIRAKQCPAIKEINFLIACRPAFFHQTALHYGCGGLCFGTRRIFIAGIVQCFTPVANSGNNQNRGYRMMLPQDFHKNRQSLRKTP